MRETIGTVLVAAMVVLAGCGAIGGSGDGSAPESADPADSTPTASDDVDDDGGADGDGSASTETSTPTLTPAPTPTPTPTPASGGDDPTSDSGLPPGVTGEKVTNASKLTGAFFRQFDGHVEFDMRMENSTGQDVGYYFKNDTERQLYRLSRSDRDGDTIYYVTDGPDARHNESRGTTRYGEGDSTIELQAKFLALFLIVPAGYVNVMEWEKAGTTTVDGDTAYVLQSDSLNRTAQTNSQFTRTDDVEAVEGELTVRSDGFITKANMTVTSRRSSGKTTEVTIFWTASDDGDITVEQPPWFDESEASG